MMPDSWHEYIAPTPQEQRAFRWGVEVIIRFSIVPTNDRVFDTEIVSGRQNRPRP